VPSNHFDSSHPETFCSRRLRRLAASVSLAAVVAMTAAPVAAQGGHFTAGDLFIDSASVLNMAGGAAIVRVDPVTHASSVFIDTTTTFAHSCFDPYRQRLIFTGATDAAHPFNHWMADGLGNLQALGPAALYSRFAPTGDGRIYMLNGGGAPFAWLDAANIVHTLMDSSGVQPYLVDGVANYSVRSMVYDPITNSLFLTSSTPCGGGTAGKLYVRRVPLSADGTRVIGPADCGSFDVTGSAFDVAESKSLTRLPDGRLLIVADTSGGTPGTTNLPRLVQVDPVSFAITPFAFTGNYPTAGVLDGGTWSEALNKVVVLDSFADNLRSFAEGTAGPGTAIAPIGSPVSSTGGSAELTRILDIPSSACTGGWIPYGTGLPGNGGFVPTLIGAGCPEAGAVITLKLANAVGGASAALFVGVSKAALPFKGGTLHLVPALTFNLPLGGTPGVAGAGSFSLPALLPGNVAGLTVYLQAAISDTAAFNKVSLTQGVQMEIG